MIAVSFIFKHAFPLGRVAAVAALGGLGIPHGQQQFQIVLLAPVATRRWRHMSINGYR